MAFLNPACFRLQPRQTQEKRICVQSSLIPGGTGGRRRRRTSNFANLEQDSLLPPQLLTEVRRLVRSRVFLEKVKEALGWPFIRFTGIIFKRCPVSDDAPDGIPLSFREFEESIDYNIVVIPPGTLLRARKESGAPENVKEMQLCAVFEIYGSGNEQSQAAIGKHKLAGEDLEKQLLAWSDKGQSMRTETDLLVPQGSELFHESMIDFLQ